MWKWFEIVKYIVYMYIVYIDTEIFFVKKSINNKNKITGNISCLQS